MLSASIKVAAVFILGISPVGLVVFEAVMLACAQFQHANLSLPSALERWLWHTFVPPEMHRIHHTPKDEDTNSNYGTIFTLWDRLFGTLNARRRFPSEPFGVTELSASSEGLPRLLVLPFRLQLSDKPKTSA